MNLENYWTAADFLMSLGPIAELQFFNDVDDWLNNISYKMQVQSSQKKIGDNFLNRRISVDEAMTHFLEFFKSSIGNPTVKMRLEMLMGSNIVRLTERKYMTKLRMKLKENHEKQQQQRIEERKKQEMMRTKNMVLRQFIPVQEAPVEIRQYPLLKLYLYYEGLIEKKRRSLAPKKIKMPKSLYKSLYPEDKEEVKEADDDEYIYLKKHYDGAKEHLVPLNKDEIHNYETEQNAIKDMQEGYMMSQDDYDRLHYEAEGVKDLRNAKNVEELYKKAYDIIGILYSHAEKEQKFQKDQEKQNELDTV